MNRQLKLTITRTFQLDDETHEDSMWGFETWMAEAGDDWQTACKELVDEDVFSALEDATWAFEIVEQETPHD